MNLRTFLPALAIAALSGSAFGQCDTIASVCEKHITQAYIPDGQFYRALLSGEEMAEFNLTLFGGTTYRVAACSGFTDRNLIFSVLDRDRNVLFTNKEFSNEPYWDLVVAEHHRGDHGGPVGPRQGWAPAVLFCSLDSRSSASGLDPVEPLNGPHVKRAVLIFGTTGS
ncbi:MAG: hypothetical protein V9F04_05395 [Dermatophilaceae bacterium]